MTNQWIRYRFNTQEEDYRPVVFPPPGPWWCTGFNSNGHAVIVAYLPVEVYITDYWPEAEAIDVEFVDSIVFTCRFSAPDWWDTENNKPKADYALSLTTVTGEACADE